MGMWIHIMRVAQREVRRTMSHPRYLLLLAASVVFTSVFFATMTRDGQPQRLRLLRKLCLHLDMPAHFTASHQRKIVQIVHLSLSHTTWATTNAPEIEQHIATTSKSV